MELRCKPPLAFALIALAFGLAAPAFGATLPPGTSLSPKQEMVRNNGAEPDSLDPALIESVPANSIDSDLFEGLTAVDHHGAAVPGVAESWKQADATTWVFKLRRNAVW